MSFVFCECLTHFKILVIILNGDSDISYLVEGEDNILGVFIVCG